MTLLEGKFRGGRKYDEVGSMIYRSIHKCRLCGETYSSRATTGKDIALKVMSEITVFGASKLVQSPTVVELHHCTDGSIGLADFQGFEYKA